ncbi:carbohydrate ABC transporter permease [Brachybacterium sp. NPDC056505]|uniref:carbohydrate ABC transporter permease n=1 Tax=Brachybacterium sp. NPDC056505 TaxID=3345843 RepID=UPI00366C52E5
MNSHRQSKKTRAIVLYTVLILGIVPTVLPLVWLVRSSLMGDQQIFTSPPEWIPDPWLPQNYAEVFSTVPFGRYLLNTIIVEAGVLVGMILSCSLAAFSFSRMHWRGRDLVFGLTISTLLLPYAVTIIPTFWMWQNLGAIDTFVPLIAPAFFGGAGMQGAFYIFMLRQFFLNIPYELDEAAYVDGASPWWVWWRVIMPLAKPAVLVVVIFTFVNTWKDFLGPLIYLNSQKNYTLAVGLASFQGAYTGQWGLLMAAATMVLLPVVLLFFLAQKYFVQGVTFTGGK